MLVKLERVRLCFPALFAPKVFPGGGDARFSAVFAIDPNSANAKALAAAIEKLASEKWASKARAVLTELYSKGRVCYKREPLSKDGQVYDGFEGMHSLAAGATTRPLVIDRDKSPLTPEDGKPYAGCYVNAHVELWPQDNQYGKRVNATLVGVQFVADGAAFGGGRPASPDDFDAVEVADDLPV